MDCGEVRELLSPMTDREVTPDELREVEEHLRSCRDCAFESTMIVGLKRLLGSWDGVHASEGFRAGVLERVKREPPPGRMPRIGWRALAAAGAVAALGSVSVVALTVGLGGERRGPGASAGGASRARGLAPDASRAGGAEAGGEENAAPARAALPPPPPAGTHARPVAQVTLQENAVYIEHPDSFPALASAGDELRPGQAVRTSEKGLAELALVSGFRLRLEAASSVAFVDADGAFELRAGRALLRGPFDPGGGVRPARALCGRTEVVLSDEEALVELALLEGGELRVLVGRDSARVVHADGEQRLDAGREMVLSRDGSVKLPPREGDAEALAALRSWGAR